MLVVSGSQKITDPNGIGGVTIRNLRAITIKENKESVYTNFHAQLGEFTNVKFVWLNQKT